VSFPAQTWCRKVSASASLGYLIASPCITDAWGIRLRGSASLPMSREIAQPALRRRAQITLFIARIGSQPRRVPM
jgi:hypothetical protein